MWNGWTNSSMWDHRFLWFLGPLALIDIVLKGFALWKAAKKGQQVWFIALLLVNSVGILPGIYLLLNRETALKKTSKKSSKSKKK